MPPSVPLPCLPRSSWITRPPYGDTARPGAAARSWESSACWWAMAPWGRRAWWSATPPTGTPTSTSPPPSTPSPVGARPGCAGHGAAGRIQSGAARSREVREERGPGAGGGERSRDHGLRTGGSAGTQPEGISGTRTESLRRFVRFSSRWRSSVLHLCQVDFQVL